MLLSGAFLPLLGLFGLGLGALVRNSAAGIGLFAAIVVVLPPALAAVSGHAADFTPEVILSGSVAAVVPQAGSLSPWAGFGLVAAYAAVALTAGLAMLVHRDA